MNLISEKMKGADIMRIYALYDESLSSGIALAYIFYYPSSDEWYIEITNEVESQWQLPFILDHFYEQGYEHLKESPCFMQADAEDYKRWITKVDEGDRRIFVAKADGDIEEKLQTK